MAKRNLGQTTLNSLCIALSASINYARENLDWAISICQQKCPAFSSKSARDGIATWVSDETYFLSPKGEGAIFKILSLTSDKQLEPIFYWRQS